MKFASYLIPVRLSAVMAASLAVSLGSQAASVFLTWTGGGANWNWNNSTNWSAGGPPPTGSPYDSLVFSGTANLNTSNNFATLSASNLVFSAGGFTLNGNAVTVQRNITNSAGLNVINLPLTLGSNPKTWDVAAGAELDLVGGTLTGTFTGSTPFEKTDFGAVRFKGTNIWAKGGDITNGAAIIDGGTSSLIVTNDGFRLEAANGDWAGLQVTNGGSLLLGNSGTGTSNLKLGNVGSLTGTNELDISSGEILLNDSYAQFIVAAAVGAIGVVNQTGGQIIFSNNAVTADLLIANNTGTVGTYNLSGGILQVPLVQGGSAGGSSYFNFNGGTLTPYTSVNAANFIQGLTALNVQNGGAVIDTTNINVNIAQPFLNAGSGGLTKRGSGTLTLTGAGTYVGATVVTAGELIVPTAQTGGGSLQVADAAALGVTVSSSGSSLNASALTLGGAAGATNEFFLGASGNPASPVIRATNLTVNGTITVNIYGAGFSAGEFPLIKYGAATGITAGSFQANILPVGVAAYLSNNVANSSVDLVVTAAPTIVWTGAAGSSWDIDNSFNWYSPAASEAVTYGDGTTVQFDDTATGSTNVTLALTVSPGGMTVTNNALAYSFSGSGSIGGAGQFTKNGPGTVNVATANTYSGNTVINGGTFQLGTSQAIPGGAAAGNVTVNGDLDLNGNIETINGLNGDGLIDSSAGFGSLALGSNNASGTFSGEITNTGGNLSLIKIGTGTELLTGNNGFSGGLTLAGGELQIASGNALGTGLVEFSAPATGVTLASYGGSVTVTNAIDVAGGANNPVNFDTSAGDIILNTTLLAAGQDIFKKGYNNLWLTPLSESESLGGYLQLYQGSFIVNGGVWTNASAGIRTYANGSDIVHLVITNGGTFAVGYSGSSTYSINLGYTGGLTGTNELDISSGQLLLGPTFAQIIVGNAAGTFGVVNQSGGAVLFQPNTGVGVQLGNNTGTTGWYYLNGGILSTPRVIGGSGTGYFYFNGGVLTPSSATSAASFVSGFTAAYVGNGGAIIDTTNINVTVKQSLLNGGTGGLTKLGVGTLTLTGTNTYTGPTVVSNGTAWLPTVQSGGGAITVADGAALGVTLAATGTTLATPALTLGGSVGATNEYNLGNFTNPSVPILYATNLTVNGTIPVNVTGLHLTLGQFSLIQYGSATGLTGASFQLTGAVLSPGLAAYLSNNIANSSIDLVVTPAPNLLWTGLAGSTWDIATTTNWLNEGTEQASVYADGSFVQLDDSATGSTTVTLAANVAPASTTVTNNVLTYNLNGSYGIGGVGGFTKTGSGTVIVGTPNTYSGNTVINAGTFQLGASQVIPDGPNAGNVIVNGRLDLAGNADTVNGLSGGGVIDSSAGLGALTLGSNNAEGIFTGEITNTGGTLSLTKVGTNTLILTGGNGYSGGTTLVAGTLQVGNGRALGTGPLAFAISTNGATLATYGGAVTLTNAVTASASSGYNANFDTTAGDLVLAGPVTSTAAYLVKLSTNNLWFTSAAPSGNTGQLDLYGGNVIFDGTSWTNSAAAIRTYAPTGTGVRLIITNDATLTLGGAGAFNIRLGYGSGLAGTNELDISSGELVLESDFEQIYAGDEPGTYGGVNQTGGTVLFEDTTNSSGVGVLLASSAGSTGWYYLSGGQLITPQVIGGSGTGTFYFNGGTLTPGYGALATNFFSKVTATYVANGGAVIDTTNISITVSQSLLNGGTGGLTKLGVATLTLTGTNTYAGPTLVSNGTLVVNGTLGTNAVTVSSAALGGTGIIGGAVTINANGTLILGSSDPYYTGTLTVSNNVTINGSLFAKLKKALAQSNDVAVVSGTLVNTGTGTLTLTNAGPALALGDTFQLFNRPVANGGRLTLTPAPGAGWSWQNNLAVNGTVTVVTTPVAAVNVLTSSVSGNQLTLAWPASYQGWILEAQTNSLTGTWVPVAGTGLTNQIAIPIDPAQGSVFFQLVPPAE